jgi:membrane protease YdiL (CAAX protease family)
MEAVWAVGTLTIGFVCFHFLMHSEVFHAFFLRRCGVEGCKIYRIHGQRMAGVFFYFILPSAVILGLGLNLSDYGLATGPGTLDWFWVLALVPVIVLLNFMVGKTPDNLAMYPQIRTPTPWKRSLTFGSAFTWSAYMFAYEFLYRGWLLFACKAVMPLPLAITLNLAFYAITHVPKGWKETIGAIPMGLALCLLTLKTGAIWTAVIVHISLALSNEWWSLYYCERAKKAA